MTDTTQRTNSEGSATFNLQLNTPGKYSVKAIFAGGTNFDGSQSTTHNFKVPNSSSALPTPSITLTNSDSNSIYWNIQTSFTATVTVNGSGVNGLTVYFVYVNNQGSAVAMGNATTNSNGVATINFTSTDKTEGSIWTIYAYTEATSSYNASRSNNITVTNHRIPTSLTLSANPSSLQTAGTTTLSALLKDTKNNAVIGSKTVTFKKGSTTLGTATTDSSTGVATKSNVSVSETSSFAAVYTQSSSDGYAGCTSSSVTVTVADSPTILNTTLTIESYTNNEPIGSNLEVVGKLVDSTNTPVSGATVTMNITSTTDSSVNINQTATTNSSGVVTFTRAVTGVGTWKIKLIYNGLAQTYNASTSSTVTATTYNSKATSITGLANTGASLTSGDVIDPVLRKYDNSVLGGKTVTITLSNGQGTVSYNGTTSSSDGKVYGLNGSASGLKLALSGTYNLQVTVSFAGDSNYDSTTVTRTYSYSG